MNEQLNNTALPSFPDWHNNPLRLTMDEINNPITVILDFFQSYHLPDIRFCLHNWLLDSLPKESVESKAHFSTYEDIEKLVEACWLIRQNQKEKNDQRSLPISEPNTEPTEVLGKTVQLIECVESKPFYVITEVFKSESLSYLRDQLRDWLHVGLSADCSIYENGEQRRQLLVFQDQLLVLMEALFVFNYQNLENDSLIEQFNNDDNPRLLSQDQIGNPMPVIVGFFEKFPMAYSIRELNDWLEAGIAYAGDYPDNMSELQVLYTYRNVLCLVESAKTLILTVINKSV
jgi:hypothetical protein